MEIKASLQYVHIAPRKVRILADLLRGKDIARAMRQVRGVPKRAALPLLKLIQSAAANARHNFHVDEGDLYIKELRVDGGPAEKRFMPRAFGRAAPRRKKTSHVSLVLDTKKDAARGQRGVERKSAGPAVREFGAEDIKGMGFRKKEVREDARRMSRPLRKGFVQRVFRRKAI